MAAAEARASENQEAAEAFFEENKDADGVQTTASGLQYKLDTEGDGPVPTEGQVVTLNYRGTLLDGTEFDSSYGSPEPAEFPVGAVIPGFNEALLLMPVGSEGTIWIPADLAYGDSPPRGSVIEPGSALVFALEILGVSDEESMPAGTVRLDPDTGMDADAGAAGAAGTAGAAGAEMTDGGEAAEQDEEPELDAIHRDVIAD